MNDDISERSSGWQKLPDQAAVFVLPVRLAMTTINPCRHAAMELMSGQPLKLTLQPDNPRDPSAVCLVSKEGCIAGYLYAETAAWMAMLLRSLPSWKDDTVVMSVQRAADKLSLAPKGKRFPIVQVRIKLLMPVAWPLYTIAAMVGFPMADFGAAFNLPGNAWLQPLNEGYADYQRLGFDRFAMPADIVRAWRRLSQGTRQN